jgi:hypothetical protein
MTVLLIRPHSWDLALFTHVAGAILVTASLLLALVVLYLAWRSDEEQRAVTTRFGFFTLLVACIPSYIIMRVGAEWIASKEGWDNVSKTPTWLSLGFAFADAGGVVLLIATILTGIGARRMRLKTGGGAWASIGTVLVGIVFVLYVVAIWAMTSKPT